MDLPLEASDKHRLDAEGRVDEEIACRRCGYNLRGLSNYGVCPECGTAVGHSTCGDGLRFCDPAWVCTLASGMNWIVAGIALFIGASVVTTAAEEFLDAQLGIYAEAMRWIFVAIGLIWMVGCWKVTTPDPGNTDVESRVSLGNVVRVGMVPAFMFMFFSHFPLHEFVMPASGPPRGVLAVVHAVATTIVFLLGVIMCFVGMVSGFVYAGRLARRIPSNALARQTRTVMWGFLAVCLTLVITVAAVIIPSHAGRTPGNVVVVGSPFESPLSLLFWAYVFLGSFFWIWWLILVVRYRAELQEAARTAMATWTSPTSGEPRNSA